MNRSPRRRPARAECAPAWSSPVQALEIAVADHRAGRYAAAEWTYRKILQAWPEHADTLHLLGVAMHQDGRTDEGIALIERAIRIQPDNPVYHSNLAGIQQSLGRLNDAEASVLRLIALDAENVAGHFELGVMRAALGRPADAAASFQRVLGLCPTHADAYLHLGRCCRALGAYDDAAAALEQAHALRPQHVPTLGELVDLRAMQGRVDEALAGVEAWQALDPSPAMRLQKAWLLPVVPASPDALLAWRRRWEAEIDALLADPPTLADPLRDGALPNFHLAHHGENNRVLQEKAARLYRQACPTLTWTAPHCHAPRPPRERRIRLGIVSAFLEPHPIGKLYSGLIRHLDRDRFDLHVFQRSSGPLPADHAAALRGSLADMRRTIAAAELDVLFYPEIGMDLAVYFLAFARLAPVQCAGWGHPDTTGLRSIDYFVSSEHLEPPDAEAHYTERLVRLRHLPTCYERPPAPPLAGVRAPFGLRPEQHVYLCPHSPFKLHPDFDPILVEILRRDPQGRVLLVEGASAHWTRLLQARLRGAGPDVAERVAFMSALPDTELRRLAASADVVLDPPRVGPGNTPYEVFSVGAPIVTWPGPLMRGRITYACYRAMGLDDGVARDLEDYAARAVRLGTDPAWRAEVAERIRACSGVLYDDRAAVREIEDFFAAAVATVAAAAPA